MENFYGNSYNFYSQSYWKNKYNNLLTPNGFTYYPNAEYNYLVRIIDDLNNQYKCNIMDVCCGNGLLLKHLMEHCRSQIIPFGIDFIKPSIKQAVKVVHPNYRNNFFLSNAIEFDFSTNVFDFILLDPYHFTNQDLTRLLQTLIKQVSNSVIFYTYADVLINNNFKSVVDFPVLARSSNMNIFNYDEISIAVLSSCRSIVTDSPII
ncbi:MAG: class I SAM-dependent methyltransferase [Bacteroidales bacterium]|nr:class I SAM-dependent methyltransferase [Bacteroidales bacterium]